MQSTAMPTAEQHGFRPHSDGAFVPVQTRSERFRSTDVSEFAPVTGREHEWKYSPVAAFADLTSAELARGARWLFRDWRFRQFANSPTRQLASLTFHTA